MTCRVNVGSSSVSWDHLLLSRTFWLVRLMTTMAESYASAPPLAAALLQLLADQDWELPFWSRFSNLGWLSAFSALSVRKLCSQVWAHFGFELSFLAWNSSMSWFALNSSCFNLSHGAFEVTTFLYSTSCSSSLLREWKVCFSSLSLAV